uniref:TROVE domain-containing protein n=1 Tax=Glossina brevipalpis TaxID=37001 RepID=A0A1A9W1X2_9MUSC
MELDAIAKLRRFCFLGSLEPVYVHLDGNVKISYYWPLIREMCKEVKVEAMIPLLKEVLVESDNLVRRDEPIFVYASYLAADVDAKQKTGMRLAFTCLICNDNDLFLFCKYAILIAKEQNRKGFSKTVRKAISCWYETRPAENLQEMWLKHRGQHGFTHKALLKLCRLSDAKISGSTVPFFKSCTQLIEDSKIRSNVKENELNKSTNSNTTKEQTDCKRKRVSKVNTTIAQTMLDVATLRTTTNKKEALNIIRSNRLRYDQVPTHFLKSASIMEVLIPSMTYLQLLKYWRRLAQSKLLQDPKIMQACERMLSNRKLQRKIQPITFLINMRRMGIRGDITRMSPKRVENMKMKYIQDLYQNLFTFASDKSANGMRMHITINLQASYKIKFLKNHRKLSFYDAAIALAFGYFKREQHVDVFHWFHGNTRLERIAWCKTMDIKKAIACCDNIQNIKNSQRLVIPLVEALLSDQIYDVFLCIVPNAGRGNPNQKSNHLCMQLDKYRLKSPKAKFIILDLLKYRRSMNYSQTRKENILEICGLDEHTTDIIHNFITHRFD